MVPGKLWLVKIAIWVFNKTEIDNMKEKPSADLADEADSIREISVILFWLEPC
jgi:hypothetical protein